MDDESDDTAQAPPRRRGFIFDGKQRVTATIAGLALFAAAAIGTHAFLSRHVGHYFVRSASAQTANDAFTQQIKKASDAAQSAAQAAQQAIGELRTHVAGEELHAARNKIDTLRTEISNTKLWESANGPNDVSRGRLIELENALERTRAFVNCLEQQRPNCVP